MKKFVALLLALATLLAALSALAEEKAAIVRLSDLSLSYVGGESARSVRFEGATLMLALGMPEGAPTLQMMFESGMGQAVDAVVQLAGQEIMFSVGGISDVYYVNLERFASPGNSAADIAKGLTNALSLACAHLDVLLYAATREGEDGTRSLTAKLPMPQLIGLAETLLDADGGIDNEEDMALEDLRYRVESLEDEALMGFRYNPSTGAFDLAAIQAEKGMRLSGTMALTFEPMSFIDVITGESEVHDVMNLTEAQQEELQGDLAMLLPKFLDFADGTGASDIIP